MIRGEEDNKWTEGLDPVLPIHYKVSMTPYGTPLDTWGLGLGFPTFNNKKNPHPLGVPEWAKQDSNLRPPLCKRYLWVVHYVFILHRVVIRLLCLEFMGERVHYVPIFHVVFWYLHTNYPRHDGREATCSNTSPKILHFYFLFCSPDPENPFSMHWGIISQHDWACYIYGILY